MRPQAAALAGERPAAADPAAAYAALFGFGQALGSRTTLGSPIPRTLVLRSARSFAARRLSAGARAREAFEGFLRRAGEVDAGPTNHFRKRVLSALAQASILPSGKLAAFFDSLVPPAEAEATREFRRKAAPWVVDSFRREAGAWLAERSRAHPGPERYNVAAIVLTGSFAYGTATPGSDLDLAFITRDGTPRGVADLLAELKALPSAPAWPAWRDVERHLKILQAGGREARSLVEEFPSVVITPDDAIRAELEPLAGRRPFWKLSAPRRALALALEPLWQAFARARARRAR